MQEELRDDEHLLRAVWPNYIRADGSIRSAAFKPRDGEMGISVERSGLRTLPVAIDETKKLFSQKSGLVSISVPDCKDAGTYPVPDGKESRPYHTLIYSNPEKLPLDPIQWDELAQRARVCLAPIK